MKISSRRRTLPDFIPFLVRPALTGQNGTLRRGLKTLGKEEIENLAKIGNGFERLRWNRNAIKQDISFAHDDLKKPPLSM